MTCQCGSYKPITLDRKSINKRIRESRSVRKQLLVLATNEALDIHLLRCPHCEQLWQSGREWHFANREYLFQVPEIEIASWLELPYMQPAAMMIFSAMMENFVERGKPEPSTKPCRRDDCEEQAMKDSVLCVSHHIESLQRVGLFPETPVGRLFPPYGVGRRLE